MPTLNQWRQAEILWNTAVHKDPSAMPTEAKGKRTTPPRASDHTREFLKDWQHLTHSGRYNMRQL